MLILVEIFLISYFCIVANYFAIIIHELGHLFFGLLTGYKFISIKVGRNVLVKQNGKMKWKKDTSTLTAGECLMLPKKDGHKFKLSLYQLGGGLFNAVFAVMFFIVGCLFGHMEILQVLFFVWRQSM